MKKLIVLLSYFFFMGCALQSIGQTPVTRTASSPAKTQNTTTSSNNRQMKKGDSQLSRANNSYQKAQAHSNRTTTTQTGTPARTNISNNSSNTGRPVSSATTTKPSATTKPSNTTNPNTTTRPTAPSSVSSSVNKPSQTQPPTSSRPASSTVVRPSSNNSASTTVPSRNAQSSSNVVTKENTTNHVSTISSSAPNIEKRGYNTQGQAQPQVAAIGGRRDEIPGTPSKPNTKFGPDPYTHPNHHNFGGHVHIPSRVRPVYYGGVPYYFYNSMFCRMINGYYVICRPPLGAVIAYSIFNTWNPVVVIHNNVSYYYDDGTFYRLRNKDYVVVNPPIGARVAELPSNYQTIILDGRVYYKVDNVYFKEVVVRGYYWYEVLFVA